MSAEALNGTMADVAAFFRVSARTVKRWNSERPPRIAFWRDGGRVMYGEEDVCRYRAAHYVASERLQAGEALERARREWRGAVHSPRSTLHSPASIEDLARRVSTLEALVLGGRKEAA